MNHQYVLPSLPFAIEEVKRVCSGEQIEVHYEKHHKVYVEKVNLLLAAEEASLSELSVDQLIRKARGPLFNNVSQAWNHTFLWQSMASPKEGKRSLPHMTEAIDKSFQSVELARDQFVEIGKEHFGSGWLWLAMRPETKRLEWIDLHDGESPLKEKWTPLLAVDLWEHAYYIDYRNQRERYLRKFFEHLNWSFAVDNFRAGRAPSFDSLLRKETAMHRIESVRKAS